MKLKLFKEAILKFLLGVILVALFLFVPAGSISYFHGWLFMSILFIPMFIAGIIMLFKSPDLLKNRLMAKENEKEQKILIKLSGLMFILEFIIAGLNYRFSWTNLPNIIIIISVLIFLISYILYALVLRENVFLLRTINVLNDQKVIDTGFYKLARHPMYTITIFLFLSMPLILNSIVSFLIFLIYPFIIIKRLKNEEDFLEKNLDGYKEYMKKVKYRLIPFIW